MSMHKITFFPLGNADTTLIKLSGGDNILWDFANMKDINDKEDKRCDLPKELDKRVKNDFKVVCFTHGDNDHLKGFSDYFHLEYADKYQTDGRKKIETLWVPAAILLDTDAKDEAKILKMEARHRLKNKKGILVFSRPEKMKAWCDDQEDLKYDDVKHLFIDAGKNVPNYTINEQGVEFFVHSPFQSETKKIDRNNESIIVQVTFDDNLETKLMLGGDGTTELWKDIIDVTKYKNNEDKLIWDIFHISHHCSYLSLNTSGNKGVEKTEPIEEIKWLFETQGNDKCRIISPSKPIPTKGSKEDNEDNPPYRQAANYYKDIVEDKKGEFLVTMEYPSINSPKPIEFEIDYNKGLLLKSEDVGSATFPYTQPTPRAGSNG